MRNMEYKNVYQFKITLKGIRPPIWRRIQVPVTYTFWDLHVAIQDAMGWWDYHLHEFELDDPFSGKKTNIGMLDDDIEPFDDREILPEEKCVVGDWFSPQNNKARYLYDFGDGWEHEVVLEDILPREKGVEYPVCTGGERACPPEDCGGVRGYAELLEAVRDVKHEEHDRLMERLGGKFDPEHFALAEVEFDDPVERRAVAFGGREGIKLPLLRARNSKKWYPEEAEDDIEVQALQAEVNAAAATNALRLDIVALLDYIGDRSIKLTQAGNLPLKDVRAINDLFIEPEELDDRIGDRVYKLRTEDEAQRVKFLRILSQKAGLTKVRNNRISTTKAAAHFLKKGSYEQLKLLLVAWLTKDHWGRLTYWPELLEPIMERAYDVAEHISRLPAGERIDYYAFEQSLLSKLHLRFATEDQDSARRFSYMAIAMSILLPLEWFGVVSLERAEHEYGYSKIVALRLTDLGKSVFTRSFKTSGD